MHASICAFHRQGAHAPSVWYEKESSNKGNTHQKMNREAKLTAACAAVACAIRHDERQRTNHVSSLCHCGEKIAKLIIFKLKLAMR